MNKEPVTPFRLQLKHDDGHLVRRSCRQNGSLECTRPYDDVAYAAACVSIVIASPIRPTAIHWAMPYHAIEVHPLSLNGLRLPSSSKRSMRLSRRIRMPLWCRIRSQPSSHACCLQLRGGSNESILEAPHARLPFMCARAYKRQNSHASMAARSRPSTLCAHQRMAALPRTIQACYG